MNYGNILKQLGVNALFWTGIMAIVLTLFQGDYYFALFFAGLVVLNFVIIMLVNKLAPQALKIEEPNKSELMFKIKPVKYPKVLDEEKHSYLPEFIHVDIFTSKGVVFAGDLARNALKQLRDSLDQALATEIAETKVIKAKQTKKKAAK